MLISKTGYLGLIVIIAVLLVSTTGCEKDGAIKIINRTSFPLYANIYPDQYTIQGGASKTIDVSTSSSSIFNPDVEKAVKLGLRGETYMIYDDYDEIFVPETTVYVKPGKTTNVYVDPNRASVKVRNLSDSLITQIIVERHLPLNTYYNTYDVSIPLEQEWYQPIVPATVNNQFYLIVKVFFSGGTHVQYGDTSTVKEKDEQFLITVLPPVKK